MSVAYRFEQLVSQSKVFVADGVYKVIGSKLEMTMKLGDQDEKSTRTVTKLTDTELVTTDEKGMERSFARMEAK